VTRWLDALGWLKWPSLLLIASPLAAYPFWLPERAPARDCGPVTVEGRAFRAFRSADGSSVILRPIAAAPNAASALNLRSPVSFDSGGMVVDPEEPGLAALSCSIAAQRPK
jgi:hypothetical protein